jgi:hypothetical protein
MDWRTGFAGALWPYAVIKALAACGSMPSGGA